MTTPDAAAPPPLPDVILHAREFARRGLEEALARLHPDLARICGYYFGWNDAEGTATNRRGSRTLQAAMVMLAARATGQDEAAAAPGAAAVELTHNFSLLHDDIADGDEIRRDRPTAWVAFGTGPTLVAGDALFNEAVRLLAATQAATTAVRVFTDGVAHMIHAWASEPAFDRTDPLDISLDAYLECCRGKGGALLGTGAVLGTVLCGKPAQDGDLLRRAAHHAGTAWQAVNDLENIWGNAALVGKPGFQDLRLRKHTLPVITAMQSQHPHTRHLRQLLAQPAPDDNALQTTADLLEELGGKAATERVAQHHLTQALATLDEASLPKAVHEDLAELLQFTVTRRPSPHGRRA
ncbi:polyprenyl synthetase family protein [Streptomyces monomycini]|uniref:polyprenyl synthetase family protein n=1 Tax=Streptomyces monomycini TaxID=371720 RepID=UPI0004AB1751|nr:polyprenyl synthetase family protein [Streptomyces monomycini]